MVLSTDIENDEAYVIHCLTTKNNRLNAPKMPLGCHEQGRKRYWVFPAGYPIGVENYSFAVDTYIFFLNNIRKCSISRFNKQLGKGIFGIAPLDFLPKDMFKQLLGCIIASGMAPEELEDGLIYLKGTL